LISHQLWLRQESLQKITKITKSELAGLSCDPSFSLLPSVQVFLNWLWLWRASRDFLSDVLSDGRRAKAIGLSRSPIFAEATAGKLVDDAARQAR
jgi:hypothetical protein